MILSYETIRDEVIKDFRNYTLYQTKKKNRILLFTFLVSIVLWTLSEVYYPNSIVGILPFALFTGSGGVLFIELIFFIINFSKIKVFANAIQNTKGNIAFLPRRIEIVRDRDKSVVYSHQIKRVIEVKDTVFIEVINTKMYPIRFNKNEFGLAGYKALKEELLKFKGMT